MPLEFNPFAPKQEEKARAEKLSGFFKGKAPRTDDLYEGSALLDPLRGVIEGAEGMLAGGAKFAGALADWSDDPETADAARSIADKIEYEMTRGFEAKGRGIMSRSFLDHPIRKTARLLGQVVPSILVGYGGGGFAAKALAKAGASKGISAALGFTASSLPLASVEAGDFYQEGLDAGKTPQELMGKTLSVLFGTAALETAVPLTWWLSPKRGATKIFKTAIQESGEEVAQGLWSNVHKVMGWKGTKDLYHTMMDGIAEGFVGGLLGGGMAGAVDLRKPKAPQVEITQETTEQLHKIMLGRGVTNDAGEPITIEDVQLMMREGVKRIQKEENSIIKRLFETRGKIPNVKAMLQARQDETAYEEAKLVKDPKTGDNVIQMQTKGDASKKYGPMLGKMVDEAVKSGKKLNRKEIDNLIKLERERKRSVIEAYEKLQYVAGGEHIPWNDLPVAFQTMIENEAPTNPVELQAYVDEKFNDPNVLWFMGGEADSERSTVFYGPLINYRRLGWRSNEWAKSQVSPFAWIRDFVTYMGQMGINPENLVMRGDDNVAEAFKAVLNQYSEITIGKPYGEPPTGTRQDLEPTPTTTPTADEVVSQQIEMNFDYESMAAKKNEIDRQMASGKTATQAVTDIISLENEKKFNNLSDKEKKQRVEVSLGKMANRHWQSYGSPEAFIANMKAALQNAWDAIVKNNPGQYSKNNDKIYQLVANTEVDLIGMPINDASAVEMTSLFRNPSVEVGQIVLVKEGRIIHHFVHTINSPESVPIDTALVNQMVEENQADGFYVIHNHPSGNSELSKADAESALKFKMIGDGIGDYPGLRGKFLGLAATDGKRYDFISPAASYESVVEYMNTPSHGRSKLRTKNAEVADFQRNYTSSQIDFFSAASKQTVQEAGKAEAYMIEKAGAAFKDGKIAVMFGDMGHRFLAHEYIDEDVGLDNLGEEITRLMTGHKASTYVLVMDGKALSDMQKMPATYFSKNVLTVMSKADWTNSLPTGLTNLHLTKEAFGKMEVVDIKSQAGKEKWKSFTEAQPFIDPYPDTIAAQVIIPTDVSDVQLEAEIGPVPTITLEKLELLRDVFDRDTFNRLNKAFEQAYQANDADMIRLLEQNLEAYLEDSDNGIMDRSVRKAAEQFAAEGAGITTFPQDKWSKARRTAFGAGRRIKNLKVSIAQLEAQIKTTVTPSSVKRLRRQIDSRKKALAKAEEAKRAASAIVKQERIQRKKDKQYTADVAIFINPMQVTDHQTKEPFTLPPGTYQVIRYNDDNYGAIKIQGNGFQVDISMNEMVKWAESDVKFLTDGDSNDRGLTSLRDEIRSQQTPLEGPDIKTDNPAPSPAAQRYDWKLRTFLRVGQFLGVDEEETIKKLKKYFGDVERDWVVLENKTDQKVLQDIVDKALTERNYSGFAEMVGRIAEDIIIQQVDEYVTRSYPHLEGVEHQDMVKFWLSSMSFAAEEVIALDMENYVYSNKGFTHYWSDGQIPGQINSERDANVTKYKEMYLQIKGEEVPDNVLKILEGDQYRRGMRPEALYWELMPKEIQNLILWTKANVEDPLFFKMVNSDVLSRASNVQNRLNGYTHHAWRYDPKTDQAKIKGGKQILGSQRQPPRSYNTYAEFLMAIADPDVGVGLQSMDNYATAMREYTRNSLVSVFQRETIQKMVNTVDPDTGLPVVTWQNDKFIIDMLRPGQRIEDFLTKMGYKQLKNAEGLALRSKGAFFRPWVRGDIADVLDQFYANRTNPHTWNAVNGLAKRIIMSSPYQFAMQIVSSPALWYSEYGFVGGAKAVWQEAISPLLPWSVAKGVKEEYEGMNKPFKNIETGMYDYEMVELFVKHGLKTFNSELILNSLYDHSVMEDHPLLRSKFKSHMETLKGKFGLDNYVFNNYVARNMFNYTKIFYDKGLAAGLSKDEAAKEAVKFSSDTSGMLNRNIYGNEGPFLQALLFARDFTVSFFRQLTGASFNMWKASLHGYKTGPGQAMNSFLHAEASLESMNRLQKYYAAHLARIFAAKVFFLSLAQFGLYFFRDPEDRDEEDKWMLLNEDPGKQFAIKMPYKDENGSPVYVDPLMWREINQFINFFPGLSGRGPAEFVKGKLNVGVSQVFEQMSNTDYKGDPITATGGVIPLYKQAADRILHFGKQITPPFMREEIKGLSNVSAIVGFPQKRGVNWGPGGTVGRANQVFRSLGRADYERAQIQKKVKNATNKQLTELFLKGQISREVYINNMKLRQMKLQEIFRRNRTKILKQQIKEKR